MASGAGAVAVIPARFGSTRLPGKPLLEAGGIPLVVHVCRHVARCRELDGFLVATDDERIRKAVHAAGFEAVMTSPHHATGSDRIGEILPRLAAGVIVNVQGDEPEIEPELIDRLVRRLGEAPEAGVATAAAVFPAGVDPSDPNRVKVVTDAHGRALYFSRAWIPSPPRDGSPVPGRGAFPLLHVGVYAYRRAALERFLGLPRGELETVERLEQLRLLENGVAIGVVMTGHAPAGIDTPADFEAFRSRVEGGPRGTTPGAVPAGAV